jgi:hypothetical protein
MRSSEEPDVALCSTLRLSQSTVHDDAVVSLWLNLHTSLKNANRIQSRDVWGTNGSCALPVALRVLAESTLV